MKRRKPKVEAWAVVAGSGLVLHITTQSQGVAESHAAVRRCDNDFTHIDVRHLVEADPGDARVVRAARALAQFGFDQTPTPRSMALLALFEAVKRTGGQ